MEATLLATAEEFARRDETCLNQNSSNAVVFLPLVQKAVKSGQVAVKERE
jgi:hypothetical protein